MNLTSWAWLIMPLGVCRATQIVLHDRILAGPRGLIERHGPSYARYSIGCGWCTSTQLGLVAVALVAWDFTRSAALWVMLALALSLFAVPFDRLIDKYTPDGPPPEPEPPDAVVSALAKTQRG